MRVFFALFTLPFKVNDVNAIADSIVVLVFFLIGIFDQLGEPSIAASFQVDTVVEDEIRLRSLFDIFRQRFVFVGVFADWYNAVQVNLIASYIFGNISDN